MFVDVLKAIFIAGIPVGTFSFFMVYFAYLKGYLSTEVKFKYAFKNQQINQSSLSKQYKKNLMFLHSKWITFGGGFYGLIALLTFIVIEFSQVVNFLIGVESWQEITSLFSISSFIAMFVDSIMNMIKAALWFTYWPDKVHSLNFVIWIVIAYIGYRLGAEIAKRYAILQQEKAGKEESQPTKESSE